LTKIKVINPNDQHEKFLAKGLIALQKNNYQLALKHFKSLPENTAKNSLLKHYHIGLAYTNLNKLDETLENTPEILQAAIERKLLEKVGKIHFHGFSNIKSRVRTNISQIVQEELKKETELIREEVIKLISTAINTATGHLTLKFEKELSELKKQLDKKN